MTPAKDLDFLLIGAQKAGTTSLFEYVRRHPGLYLPSEKEVSYFNLESRVERGWEWYLAWVFAEAPVDRPWGTFSTFYMDAAEGSEETVPRRVRDTIPNVKLIAIVRDPVERCISHHRMSVMKRLETRSFAVAMDELLDDAALADARKWPTESNSYVTRGEYGRALGNYLDLFPREQLLVLFAEDLERDPGPVLHDLFEYVGVDPDFVPPNLDERYRRAGDRRRIGWLDMHGWRERLARQRAARQAWERLPAPARRSADRWVRVVSYRAELWNARDRGEDTAPEIDPAVISRLEEHYAPDVERLRGLIGGEPPWPRFASVYASRSPS
jgi:hypothetical protein